MSEPRWRQVVSQARGAAVAVISPLALRLWNNAIFTRERQANPLPANLLNRTLPIVAGALMLLPLLAWVIDIRLISAVVLGLCLAAVAVPALAAPFFGASLSPVARDQSTFTSLSPDNAAEGAALAGLWRLRWLIIVALALIPALVVSLMRLDMATFTAYRDSVLALGSAAPADAVGLLLPGGGIPYFRLLIRDLSAGLLPLSALPVASALGLAGALLLDDVTFGQIAGLIAMFGVLIVTVGVWAWLSLTPILAGPLELIRLVLLVGLLCALPALALRVSKVNARLLLTR